jgi:hypothetical protein
MTVQGWSPIKTGVLVVNVKLVLYIAHNPFAPDFKMFAGFCSY